MFTLLKMYLLLKQMLKNKDDNIHIKVELNKLNCMTNEL